MRAVFLKVIGITLLILGVSDIAYGQGVRAYPITWQPEKAEKIIYPGVPDEDTVTFVSTKSFDDASLHIVPELQPYLAVDPQSLDIIAGDTNIVRLIFFAPESTPEDTLYGTIHVRASDQTHPQLLKVDLIIGGASIVDPILDVNEAAADSFASWSSIYGLTDARRMVLDWLRQQDNVDSAGLSDDGATIWISYQGGLDGAVLTNPSGTRGTPTAQTAATACPVSFDLPGTLQECNLVTAKLDESTCISAEPVIQDQEVSVNLLKTIHEYGVVVIATHGGVKRNSVIFLSGDRVNYFLGIIIDHRKDWKAGRIIPVPVGGRNYWAITPEFIRHYAASPYPHSLIVISACQSMDNSTMADAFLDNGAATYFGWLHSVGDNFAVDIDATLFERLVDDGMTTGQAFDAWTLAERTDPNGGAIFMMAGDRDLTLCELSWITCGSCPEVPEVSIDGNTISMGHSGDYEGGSQNSSVHGAAALLPPSESYQVTFDYDLHTWDSYNPISGEGTGYWDGFSVSISQMPYWDLVLTDPITTTKIPGLAFIWGGSRYGDGVLENNSGSQTLIVPADPGDDNYINVVLDTKTYPEANHNYPSWGTITVDVQPVGSPPPKVVGTSTQEPEGYRLSQNFPNPFNPETEISYSLPTDGHVRLTIYDILGRTVKTLVDEYQDAGLRSVRWDGFNDSGDRVPSGVYLYVIKCDTFLDSKHMLLLK